MKRKIIVFFLLIAILTPMFLLYSSAEGATVSATDEEGSSAAYSSEKEIVPPTLNARSAMLLHVGSGRIFLEKNADQRIFPASVTKIMSCMLALEKCPDENTVITIPKEFTAENDLIFERNGMNIGLKVGEQIPLQSLLYYTMLNSACDTASALAYCCTDSIDSFVDMMNKRAEELGAVNTHFCNAHGLHDENHYTTARDMSKIVLHALSVTGFKELFSDNIAKIPATNMRKETYASTTINMLRKNNEFYYEGALGIKSGTTTEAGKCLVSMIEIEGETFVGLVFGTNLDQQSNDNLTYTDMGALFDYAKALQVKTTTVMTNSKVLDTKTINGQKVDVKIKNDLSIPLASGEENAVTFNTEIDSNLSLPLASGEKIGTVKVLVSGKEAAEVDAISASDIAVPVMAVSEKEDGAGILSYALRIIALIILAGLIYLTAKIIIVREKVARGKAVLVRRKDNQNSNR